MLCSVGVVWNITIFSVDFGKIRINLQTLRMKCIWILNLISQPLSLMVEILVLLRWNRKWIIKTMSHSDLTEGKGYNKFLVVKRKPRRSWIRGNSHQKHRKSDELFCHGQPSSSKNISYPFLEISTISHIQSMTWINVIPWNGWYSPALS